MAKEKGQLGLENIMLFGALLVFLIALLFVSTEILSFNYKVSMLQDSVDNLVLTANTIHRLGEGNRQVATVYMPKGVNGASITGNVISVDASLRGSPTTVEGTATPKLVGEIPQGNGYFTVEAEAIDKNTVKFGDAPYIGSIVPNVVRFVDLPIQATINAVDAQQGARVKFNNQEYPTNFVTIESERIIRVWVVTGWLPPAPGSDKVYTVTVVNPDGKTSNPLSFTVLSVPGGQ